MIDLFDPQLAQLADLVDDLERVRIANANRLDHLTRIDPDSDGERRGLGLPVEHPIPALVAEQVEQLAALEHQAIRGLERQLRTHPLYPWLEAQRGVGPKQSARLLAAIGDPYWNTLHDRARTVSELWQYCGYGDAATQVRVKGQVSKWNATAKMRTWLIAKQCVISGKATNSTYYQVYTAARERYADAVHEAECRRCGPKGHPAPPGSPLSLGHQEARGHRAICKALLRDLWAEAARLHGYKQAGAA